MFVSVGHSEQRLSEEAELMDIPLWLTVTQCISMTTWRL